MTIDEMIASAFDTAENMGWHTQRGIPEALCLVHSEVSEALEVYREPESDVQLIDHNPDTGKPEGFPIELADILIRVADLAGTLHIDLQEAVRMKLEYNTTRTWRHGGKRA